MLRDSDKAALLIVDDTPTNLEILVDFFADAGFEVYVATSGEHALTQVNEVHSRSDSAGRDDAWHRRV